MLTTQLFVQKKVFGNFLSVTRPLDYRRPDWQEIVKGRERAVRVIIKSMLGAPSAHVGENEHAMWCFQLPKGSVLIIYLKGGTHLEIAARKEDEKEVQEVMDFLIEELGNKVKQL